MKGLTSQLVQDMLQAGSGELASKPYCLIKRRFFIYKNDNLDAGKGPDSRFYVLQKEVLETINLDKIEFVGYAFQIEMKFAAWKLGFKIKEVPIIFQDRTYGVSKMNKGIIKEGVIGVLKLRWHSLFKNYRKRLKNTDAEISPLTGIRKNEMLAESE